MDVRLIAVVGQQGQLDFGTSSLPWSSDEFINWFKRHTQGGVVVVGYNTYHALPILTGRTVCMVHRDEHPTEVITRYQGRTIWVAGGNITFRKWMPYVDTYVVTRKKFAGKAKNFMPSLWSRPTVDQMK